jgi:hypothetical protein
VRPIDDLSWMLWVAETGSADPNSEGEVRTLDRLTQHARVVEGIWVKELEPGDWVIVTTENSVYSMLAAGDGSYYVAGGWFTSETGEGTRVRVTGCTWGGTAICTNLVAARGMFIEFGNGVRTSRIRTARLLRAGDASLH